MTLDAFEIELLSLLILCFTSQLLFYWIILAKPYQYMEFISKMELQSPPEKPPVSVIITIKDSLSELLQFLPTILEQEYPVFEVVVVTDRLTDAYEEEFIRLKNQYPNLYSTHVPEETRIVSRKKLALTLGIKAAKYDKLLFTECDIRTQSKNWICLMARHFSDKKSIVLGFSALESSKSLWSKFIAYDYFFSNLQMISLALFNHPYAGNGRNMAYSKSHFIEQKGFVKYRTLKRGEDDLFVNEIVNTENTAVELSSQSVTIAEINDLSDWKCQKVDRMFTQGFYKRGPVAFWRMEIFSRIAFYAAIIICFICGAPYTSLRDFLLPGVASFCLIARSFSQSIVIDKTIENLQLEKFKLKTLLFDLFQPFINLYFYIYCVLKRKENFI